MTPLPLALSRFGAQAGKNFLGIGGGKMLTTAGVAGAGAMILPPIAKGIAGTELDQYLRQIQERRGLDVGIGATMKRTADLMKENQMRLATMEPHAYAELVAGRKLSKGSRLYGYSPDRSEQLQNALYGMTTGAIR